MNPACSNPDCMCNEPEAAEHPQVLIRWDGLESWVDEGIADEVLMLWRAGIETIASCEGDEYEDDLPRYVAIADPWQHAQAEHLLGWVEHRVVLADRAFLYDRP